MSSEDDLEDTHADAPKAAPAKAPEPESHSATIRSSTADLDEDDDLRDTQMTPIVRESEARALAASAAPPAVKPAKEAKAGAKEKRPSYDSKDAIREAGPSRVSVPPSEPRGSRTSFSQIDLATADRPARVQMIVALVLGLVLVAIPLYLWRRPRAETIPAAGSASAPAATVEAPPPPSTDKPQIGDTKVILCQDPGSKKTAADQCDHVADLEKAIVKAIEEAGPCAKGEGGGAIAYVADVSFKRKSIGVSTSKERTTLKSAKAISACQAAVKGKLGSVAFDAMTHSHSRYKIVVTATYPH